MPASRRILHVFKYFHPQFTGEGTFFERIAPTLRELAPHIEHDVLATLTGSPAQPLGDLDGIGCIAYLRPRGYKSTLNILEVFWWTLRNMWRYDVIHYHTHVDRAFASYWLAALFRKRIILSATLDDSTFGIAMSYRRPFRPLVRRLFSCIDAFVAISPKLHEETIAHVGAARAHLIPIGIHMPHLSDDSRVGARAALNIAEDVPVLVSVGGISARKDQLTLVHALPRLVQQAPGLLLILVGPTLEEPYARTLHAFIDEHGLAPNVRFVGWVREPWAYYAAADIMVFASREEGFGTVMIEAMSFALPVVARRLKGVNDSFIEHGRTGYLFERDEEFPVLVEHLMRDREERRKTAAAARAHVETRFAMKEIAARYLAVYGVDVDAADFKVG